MNSRLNLHAKLQEIIGPRLDKKENVYFQPPESLKMVYPCIVYNENRIRNNNADNRRYIMHDEYQVIIIEQDPDSDLKLRLINAFDHIHHDRTFAKSNLYHRNFTLYY